MLQASGMKTVCRHTASFRMCRTKKESAGISHIIQTEDSRELKKRKAERKRCCNLIMPGGDEVIQIFKTQLMKIVRDYFLCFLMMLSWAPGMAQQGSHLFSLMASCRDTPGLKEVRLLQDGRESGRRQCTPEGVTSF